MSAAFCGSPAMGLGRGGTGEVTTRQGRPDGGYVRAERYCVMLGNKNDDESAGFFFI